MTNSSTEKNSNPFFFISFKDVNSNILNLPNDIKSSKQFCLWQYKYIANSDKLTKVPYGYCKKQKRVIPSLKNKNYWFTFSEYLTFKNFFDDFNLGLILTDGLLTVIDIDNYQRHKTLDIILLNMLSKGAYIEVSPSGKGLHIFYIGKWPYDRKKSITSIGNKAIKMTCEAYCGNDVRFITLTGKSIALKAQTNDKSLVHLSSLNHEIENLAQLFFGYDIFGDMYDSLKSRSITLNESALKIDDISIDYIQIREKILASNWKKQYLNLCYDMNPSYKSVSEADWAFIQIVSRFIKAEIKNKKKILEFFYHKDRPYRAKKNRLDYFYRTVNKILSSSVEIKNTVKDLASFDKDFSDTCVNKNTVFKVCNVMRIFHLGKSVQNFQYVYKNANNYIKATNPLSLNQNDFVNYIAILQQFSQYMSFQPHLISENDYIEINVRKILQSLGKHDSGRSYERFINIVKKLAHTTIEYDKQIHINGLRSKKVGNLLMYEYKYIESILNDNDYKYKKLFIKMHPSIIDILKEAKYNYSILNYQSFLDINSNELKLLYYYFCLSTLPGSYASKFSINDLLKFWPKSENRSTLFKRKRLLYSLLDQFCYIQDKIPIRDIKISLEKKGNIIISVLVKKKQLKLS